MQTSSGAYGLQVNLQLIPGTELVHYVDHVIVQFHDATSPSFNISP